MPLPPSESCAGPAAPGAGSLDPGARLLPNVSVATTRLNGPAESAALAESVPLAESVAFAQSAEPTEPLVEELPSAMDPWDSARRLARRRGLLFLDSADRDSAHGGCSFVAADPFDVLRARRNAGHTLELLAARLRAWRSTTLPGLPPFQGGAAGVFAYELGRHLEQRVPPPRHDEFALPHLDIGFYDWVLAFDHRAGRVWLISTGLPETAPAARRRRAERRLRQVRAWLRDPPADTAWPGPPPAAALCPPHALPGFPGVTSTFRRADYLAAVRRAVDYIHAGDCFQVNLSHRLLCRADRLAPLDLYARLRDRNAAPFGGLYAAEDFVVASSSPERFLRVCRGAVDTRPIKGTRPRAATPAADAASRAELAASAKDRAENVMIVDLLRNDLGRVCAYGTIRVPTVCQVESYRYVHHLVSEVRGQLRPDCTRIDLLKAAFPGGSVTGAPKIRAMEIIAELEPTARGPYCGSLGYLGFDGSMDSNILIRTLIGSGGYLQFPVGGGIVADSVPEQEYEETLHKAAGLLRALG